MKTDSKIAFTVFAIAFAYGLNITGIMPVMGMVSSQFTGISTGMIQLLQTMPYASVMAGSAIVGWLVTRFYKKHIILAGLAVVGICGAFPFLFPGSFPVLFISRAVIGFGFGIASPLITVVITDFIEPAERAGYMGLNVIGMGLGAMSGNILGGFLAKSGMRFFYLTYLIAFACLVIVAVFLDVTPVIKAEKKSELKLNGLIYVIALMSFMHTLFINAYSTNISLYMTGTITADTGTSGLVTAINSAFALGTGLVFGRLVNGLGKATLPFSIFSAAAGYGVILFVPGMPGVVITSALCGISLSSFQAMGGYLISIVSEPKAVTKASSLYAIIGGIGGLIAPAVLGCGANMLGGNTPRHQFVIALIGMTVLGALASVVIAKSLHGRNKTD